MSQDEIFRLLLLVLLMANEDARDGSTSGCLNEIIIIGLLLGMCSDNNRTTTRDELTTFPPP